ncbi:unnamed protein product [Somion occarium]|uniref:Uncharacterized protein n=1 Tax=Somion occarium TaxID=3059160 RepID=A0ABP1DQG5_9APHY
MEAYQARLESFSKSSKRTKHSSNKASTSALKWPHPPSYKANPNALAEAGFYHNPSSEYRDNVTCFLCEKQLADWDKDDDPFNIHWDKCGNSCPWATVRCGLMEDTDENGHYIFPNPTRLPSSKTMEKARLETFTANRWWPHDSIRGHGANSKKMAKAGFVYTPQAAGDDTVTCFYCGIALSGWDEDDDPLEEHHKREQKADASCPFFTTAALGRSTSRPPPKASKPPSRTVSQSKKLRSTPVEEDVSEESDNEVAIPAAKLGGTRSKPSSQSKSTSRAPSINASSSKTPASRRSTRGTGTNGKTPASRGTVGSEIEEETEASGSEIEAIKEEEEERSDEEGEVVVEKPKRGRPKKTTTAQPKTKKMPVEKEDDTDLEPAPVKHTHTRTRSKANLDSESEVPRKQTHSRTKSASKSKSKIVSDDEALAPKSSQRSVTGKGKAKQAQHDELEDLPPPAKSKPSSASKAVSRSKSKAKVMKSESESDVDPIVQVHSDPEEEAVPPRSTSKGKHPAKAKPASSITKGDSSSKAKARTSSPTSDDAGYVTAELPMDVDDEFHQAPSNDAPPPVVAKSKSHSPSGLSNPVISKTKVTKSEEDVPMKDAHPDRDSGMTESFKAKTPPVKAEQSQPRASQRPSVRPGSRLTNRDPSEMVVVTISSDEEIEEQPKPPSRARTATGSSQLSKATSVPSTALSTSSSSGRTKSSISPQESSHSQVHSGHIPATVKTTTDWMPMATKVKKGKGKMKIEVIIPVSPVKPRKIAQDVIMHDTSEVEDSAKDEDHLMSSIADRPSHEGSMATPPPQTPSVSPVVERPSTPPAQLIPSFDAGPSVPDENKLDEAPFIPISKLTSLTEEEGRMTIEQWLRREIEIQSQKMKELGESMIADFLETSKRRRKEIEAL